MMELKMNKNNIDVQYSASELKHSLIYSLFASQTINENIDAEIRRIEMDIQCLEGMLSTDISQIILLAQSSKDETDLHDRMMSNFHLNALQAEYMRTIEIKELATLDFALIKENLEKSILFLNGMRAFTQDTQ